MAYTTSTRAVAAVPACINQAINFLTRPLILTEAPDLVVSLQSILRSTLQPAFQHSRDSRLILSLTPTSLPPRPLYAACIACGLQWADWIRLLGAREFDLIIEANAVSVTYHGAKPQTITFWSEPSRTPAKRALLARLNFKEARVPISKLGQQSAMQASLTATVNSAIARAHTRTLAQQLLESDHKQEADEIFAMISKTAIMSPTPTREHFSFDLPTSIMPSSLNAFPSPLSSPEVFSPDSSRPSSRSSGTFSTFSDDDESVTSASSVSSYDLLASTKPTSAALAPISKPVSRPIPAAFNRHAPAFVPRLPQQPSRVIVDSEKKDVTKYLYQGGVSTVLTGGVMLGAAKPTAAAPQANNSAPKYRAPIGGRKAFAAAKNNATNATSWRRTAAPRV